MEVESCAAYMEDPQKSLLAPDTRSTAHGRIAGSKTQRSGGPTLTTNFSLLTLTAVTSADPPTLEQHRPRES